jgi:hypothetical protein
MKEDRITLRRWIGNGMPPGPWLVEPSIFENADPSKYEEAEFVRHTSLLEEVLERIAVGKRSDGTYNLSREACEQLASEALERVR